MTATRGQNISNKKVLIIGSGFSGSTCARILAENGFDVEIIDKNDHIGGNMYDYKENDIFVHKYGPHIFHTSIDEVYNFLSKYTEWFDYHHNVVANIGGKLVPVPFNLTSLEMLYSADEALYIKNKLIELVGLEKKVPIVELKKHSDEKIREFADFVFKNIFEFYSGKQWGRPLSELDESVFARVPVSVSYADGYFADKYQFMPKDGYTKIFQNLLDHPNIKVSLGQDAAERIALKVSAGEGEVLVDGKHFGGEVIYTGCLDELMDYEFGALKYRTLRFDTKVVESADFQCNSVVNYTVDQEFTRISEYKKFTTFQPNSDKSVITYEYPMEFESNKGQIPYYPLPTANAQELYKIYLAKVANIQNFHLLGRLANYVYINMDVAVSNAMKLAAKIIAK